MDIEKSYFSQLLADIEQIIQTSKVQLYRQANSLLTLSYWHIGKRIKEEIIKNERAEYGKQIVVTLSRELIYNFKL